LPHAAQINFPHERKFFRVAGAYETFELREIAERNSADKTHARDENRCPA
jgi:hypothetical protein